MRLSLHGVFTMYPYTPMHTCTLRRNTNVTADNLYIADITSTGQYSVSFSLYARLDGGVLNGSALATAVLVREPFFVLC